MRELKIRERLILRGLSKQPSPWLAAARLCSAVDPGPANSLLTNNKNYIIIIRKDALNKSYKELEDNLISLFNKLKEKKDER